MSLSIDMVGLDPAQVLDHGLSANECYPKVLVDDPSFALLNRDPYCVKHGANALWAAPPTAQLINGKTPPFRKRDISYLNPNEWVLEENNSSRRLGQDELDLVAEAIALDENLPMLDEHLRMLDEQMHEVAAYIKCVGDDCATSTTLISKYDSAIVIRTFVLTFLLTKDRASMILLPSTLTGTAPSIVEATETAVNILLDAAQIKQSLAFARSGPTLPAAPEVTSLV